MAEGSNRETAEMRYLLGNLSEDHENRIEEAFFADDAKFQELEMAEAELIDAYVQKELSPADQQRFEAKLRASPRLLERVKLARLLKNKASALSFESEVSIQPAYAPIQPKQKPKLNWWEGLIAQPAFRVALAAGVFVLLAGGVALFLGWRSLRHESTKLASERAALEQQKRERDQSTNQPTSVDQLPTNRQPDLGQQAKSQRPISETPDRPVFGTVTQFLLMPGPSLRGGGSRKEFTIGDGVSTVQLKLSLENNDYSSYNVTIQSPEGKVIMRVKGLRPVTSGSVHQLIFSVPAKGLRPDDYVVDVNGRTSSGQFESVSNYEFRILKQNK